MAKTKLEHFADMKTMDCVFEPLLETLQNDEFPMKGNWSKDFFKNDNPIIVELGCGKGEYTVGLAKKYPNHNYIGIDVKGARIWYGADAVRSLELDNAAFVRIRIDFLKAIFAENEIDQIWLTFSDPQKEKPRKRLTSKMFMDRFKHVLKPGGHFVFEVHYLNNLVDGNQWDNIYHEHIYYYSISALNNFFTKYGMTVVDFEEIPIHAGSIRVTVLNNSVDTPDNIFQRIMEEHSTIGNPNYMLDFTDKVKNHIIDFNTEIKRLSKDYKIAGYGASGRANMFCNLTNLDENVVQFIVDESPERCGRYIANTKIPIVDVDTLKNSDVDLIIIFAWNSSKMIIEKTQFKNYKYLVAFPNVQLVDSYDELKGFDSI